MKQKIALKKINSLILTTTGIPNPATRPYVLSLQAEMMNLGYIMTQNLFETLCKKTPKAVRELSTTVINVLREFKGADVVHKPMYKGFPDEVNTMSDSEFYLNAIIHYWSGGQWMPESHDLPREFAFEKVNFINIDLASEDDFLDIYTRMLQSNISLSEIDRGIISWYMKEYSNITKFLPKEIPFKETMCIVANELFTSGASFNSLPLRTATDILRFVTHYSGGDISLAENTKFKSMPRRLRKSIVGKLNNLAKGDPLLFEEDIARFAKRWIRLFHSIHIGEYAKQAPAITAVAQKLRDGKTLTTTRSMIEGVLNPPTTGAVKTDTQIGRAIAKFFDNNEPVTKDEIPVESLLGILETRPGEYARRMDKVLRTFKTDHDKIISSFSNVTDQVSTRVLIQLLGRLQERVAWEGGENPTRVVFPKGSVAKAQIIPTSGETIDPATLETLGKNIVQTLTDRAAQGEELGAMYIDERLVGCPIPMGQRDASNALRQVQRGTRMPFGDKATFRFFVYWIGQDIDLSATFHNEDFKMIEQVSYTNRRSGSGKDVLAVHSGDITSAPNGASEFIDINIDLARKKGRYVVLNLYVYSGPNFGDHKETFAGYLAYDEPSKGNIFEPKLVETKLDLTGASRNSIPLVFDLETREVIFTDLYTNGRGNWGGNNVHSNKATIRDTIKAITSTDNKVSIHTLAAIHSERATEVVTTPDEADIVFSVDPKPAEFEGTWITPYDINVISADYLQ